MKSIVSFLFEKSNVIQTNDVVDILKTNGETPQEIKKEIDTTKKLIPYTEFLNLYATQCFEWCSEFIKVFERFTSDEREYEQMIGQSACDNLIDILNNIFNNAQTLVNKTTNENPVKEGVYVNRIENYEELLNWFNMLLDFEELAQKYEQNDVQLERQGLDDLVELKNIISENIGKLRKYTDSIVRIIQITKDYKSVRF